MNRHFPKTSSISIVFSDGTSGVFTGEQINGVYDEAVVEFRSRNNLDAKGFSRGPATTVQPKNKIEFVAVHAGMSH
jgi:hypothetical protein